jgi:hypothetical protein
MFDPNTKRIITCDFQGHYLSTVSGFGRGPREYVYVGSLCFKKNGCLLIGDPIQKKIIIFGPDNTYLRSIFTEFKPSTIVEISPDSLLVVSSFKDSSGFYNLALVDSQFKIKKLLYPVGPRGRRNLIQLYRFNNTLHFWDGIKNELYTINHKLDFKLRYKLTYPEMDSVTYFAHSGEINPYKGLTLIQNIAETDSFLLFYALENGLITPIIYNKKTKKSFNFKFIKGTRKMSGITNPSLFNLPTWPDRNILQNSVMSFESISNNPAITDDDFSSLDYYENMYIVIHQD